MPTTPTNVAPTQAANSSAPANGEAQQANSPLEATGQLAGQSTAQTKSKPAGQASDVAAKPTAGDVALGDKAKPAAEVAAEAKSAAPTTALEAIKAIDLLALPRIKEKRMMESSPTYVYYSAEGTLASADAFYQAELGSKGWKELPAFSPATESYADRSFEKNGFVIRVSLSVGSTQGELGVMLANLGNVDVRKLPKMADADTGNIPSSQVNATHKTEKSIPEVADTLGGQLLSQGWQPYADFHETPMDVPHYRSLRFRKEAVRINLGIVRNPQNPADKTTVFYHAEFVTPFDIPTSDSKQPLKLDMSFNRAAFETSTSRADLVALLKKDAERFGWKLDKVEEFASGDIHGLPIETASQTYLVARLVESGGKYSAWIEKSAKPTEVTQGETESVVVNEPKSTTETTQPASEPKTSQAFKDMEAEVDATIQAELSKALGSLKGTSPKGNMNIAELKGMADQITKSLGNLDDQSTEDPSDDADESNKPKKNPFDVAEDKVELTAADKAIATTVCKIKYGTKSIELRNAACYVITEYDRPTKCIVLSEGTLNVDRLTRSLLKEGEPVHVMNVSEGFKGMMDIRVSESSTMVNVSFDGASIATNSNIQSDVKYRDGKLVGRVKTTEPIEVGGQLMEFTVEINQPVIKPDWSTRNSTEAQKLYADSTKDVLVPENCNSYSYEGSKYNMKIDASIEAPLQLVEAFYNEQLGKQGWKHISASGAKPARYGQKDQEMELGLEADGKSTKIAISLRNSAAAKADAMIPPTGKAMLLLGNMSEADIQMTIGGKTHSVKPSMGSDPKDATRVIVEPGKVKIEVKSTGSAKTTTMNADVVAGSTWGVIFATDFQDVLRMY